MFHHIEKDVHMEGGCAASIHKQGGEVRGRSLPSPPESLHRDCGLRNRDLKCCGLTRATYNSQVVNQMHMRPSQDLPSALPKTVRIESCERTRLTESRVETAGSGVGMHNCLLLRREVDNQLQSALRLLAMGRGDQTFLARRQYVERE